MQQHTIIHAQAAGLVGRQPEQGLALSCICLSLAASMSSFACSCFCRRVSASLHHSKSCIGQSAQLHLVKDCVYQAHQGSMCHVVVSIYICLASTSSQQVSGAEKVEELVLMGSKERAVQCTAHLTVHTIKHKCICLCWWPHLLCPRVQCHHVRYSVGTRQ